MNKKEEKWRMEGAQFALRVARDKGVDGLEEELKRRGVLEIPLSISHKAAEEVYNNLADRTMNTIKTVVLWTLYNTYGWKKVRLSKFLAEVDKYSCQILKLDRFGNSYVTFTDMAKELEEIGIQCDMKVLEEIANEQKEVQQKMIRFDLVLEVLNNCGLEDVAKKLEQKVMDGRLG